VGEVEEDTVIEEAGLSSWVCADVKTCNVKRKERGRPGILDDLFYNKVRGTYDC
jgi:hypothetical protein